ncbi:MAG: rod shape-determining protein MreD [Treponemataceae bacterium]|nr:rod shape-determining protein MreD [Treponemataceae bacterium]
MKTFLTCFLFIFSFLFFETAILTNIVFLPVIPDLLLLFTVYVSIHRGSLIGETTGFFSGFFLDVLSASPLGLNALLRTFLGFFGGLFFLILNTNGFFIPFFLGISATLVKALWQQIISFFFPNIVYTYDFLSVNVWLECLINGLLAPVLFFLFSRFHSLSEDPAETIKNSTRKMNKV